MIRNSSDNEDPNCKSMECNLLDDEKLPIFKISSTYNLNFLFFIPNEDISKDVNFQNDQTTLISNNFDFNYINSYIEVRKVKFQQIKCIFTIQDHQDFDDNLKKKYYSVYYPQNYPYHKNHTIY